jgi:hypothetical protein
MEIPTIKYGFRGEDIEYTVRGKSAWITFTWCKGDRIYSDSIKKWKDNEKISNEDKVTILKEIISFVDKSHKRSWWASAKVIVVINTDDPDKILWEDICRSERKLIKQIEYTSNQGQKKFEREMYLGVLQAGKRLTINTTEITSEKELDDFLRQRDLGN